ncbi:MAG: HDOD domain-containing protein [Nitrospinota bacterium]
MSADVDEAVKDWVASPPHVYLKLKKALDDPRSSFKEFSGIIGHDPSLAARVLKIVNSPFYGLESKVETISHALRIIGTKQLTELVLATSVIDKFGDIPKRIVNMDSFWKHSIACGVAAKVIADRQGQRNLESFYLVGMLHDIGSLVIYKKFPSKAEEIVKRCKTNRENLFEVEREVLGSSHAKFGGRLLKGWGLPQSLFEPVYFHHRPKKSKEFPLITQVVHIADCIVDELKLGSSGETIPNPVKKETLKNLEYRELPVDLLKKDIEDQYYTALSVFL